MELNEAHGHVVRRGEVSAVEVERFGVAVQQSARPSRQTVSSSQLGLSLFTYSPTLMQCMRFNVDLLSFPWLCARYPGSARSISRNEFVEIPSEVSRLQLEQCYFYSCTRLRRLPTRSLRSQRWHLLHAISCQRGSARTLMMVRCKVLLSVWAGILRG
jgi:hypothetical protein